MGYKASMINIEFFYGQHRLEEGFVIMQLASNFICAMKKHTAKQGKSVYFWNPIQTNLD